MKRQKRLYIVLNVLSNNSFSAVAMVASAKLSKTTPKRRSSKRPLKDKNTSDSPPQQYQTPNIKRSSKSKPFDNDHQEVILEPSDHDENDETLESTTTSPSPAAGRKRKLSQRGAKEGEDVVRNGRVKRAMKTSPNDDATILSTDKYSKTPQKRCHGGDDEEKERKTPRSSNKRQGVASDATPTSPSETTLPKRRGGDTTESKRATRMSPNEKTAASPQEQSLNEGRKETRTSSGDVVIAFDSDSLFTSIVPRRDSSKTNSATKPEEKNVNANQPRVVLCPRLDGRGKTACRACERAIGRQSEASPLRFDSVSPRKEIVKTKKSILSAIAFDFKGDFDDDENDDADGSGDNLFDSIVVDVEACVAKVKLTAAEQREVEQREKEAEKERKRKEREKLKKEKEEEKRAEMERVKAKKEDEEKKLQAREREEEEKVRKKSATKGKVVANAAPKRGGRKSGDQLVSSLANPGNEVLALDNADEKRFQPFVGLNRDDCVTERKVPKERETSGTLTKVHKIANGRLSFELPKQVLSPDEKPESTPPKKSSQRRSRRS